MLGQLEEPVPVAVELAAGIVEEAIAGAVSAVPVGEPVAAAGVVGIVAAVTVGEPAVVAAVAAVEGVEAADGSQLVGGMYPS